MDLQVAELLVRYKLQGTFYVPRSSEHGVMTPGQVAHLAAHFGIGAHTLDHVVLTSVEADEARRQIAGSKDWVEQVTGKPCGVFCAPVGRFSGHHVAMMREAGFAGLRTVEYLSLDLPRRDRSGLLILPTTLQAHPHRATDYAKNIIKRRAGRNLWLLIRSGGCRDWVQRAGRLLDLWLRQGGVFHLWGHSWELEENGQWQRLEDCLKLMSDHVSEAKVVDNAQLCAVDAAAVA